MSKPSDISQSAWDAAVAAETQFDTDWSADGRSSGESERQEAREIIARAIMAETEACAVIADCDCGADFCAHRANANLIRERNRP